ncbi:MAG: porin family protein [Gammaproteobacteria bacterium]|nr:porin family protein [Gammaproteobacteria bacterium]
MLFLKKLAVVLFVSLFANLAFAGSESGLYLGASVGQGSVDTGDPVFDVDEDSSGYKVFAGYNFGVLPAIDLAVELDYRDFGSFENSALNIESDMTSYEVYGLAGFDLGPLGLFGKVGYSNTDIESVVNGINVDDSDSNSTYGVGAKFQLGSLAIRAEYEVFELDGVDDLTMSSVGFVYTF